MSEAQKSSIDVRQATELSLDYLDSISELLGVEGGILLEEAELSDSSGRPEWLIEALFGRYRNRGLLLDTNILLLLIVGRVDPKQVERFKRTRSAGFGIDDFQFLSAIIREVFCRMLGYHSPYSGRDGQPSRAGTWIVEAELSRGFVSKRDKPS